MSDNECRKNCKRKKPPKRTNVTGRNALVAFFGVIGIGWLWSMAAYVSGSFWSPLLTFSAYCAYVAVGYFGLKLTDKRLLLSVATPQLVALVVGFAFGASRTDVLQNIVFLARLFIYPAYGDLGYSAANYLSLSEGGRRVLELIISSNLLLVPLLFVLLGVALKRWKLKQEKDALSKQKPIVKAVPILENNFTAFVLHCALNVASIICASFYYWNTLVNASVVIALLLLHVFLASKLFRTSAKHSVLSVIAPAVFIVLGFTVGILTAYANGWSIESLDALTTTSAFYFFTFDISFSVWQESSLFWKTVVPIGAVVTPSALMMLGLMLKKWKTERAD